MKVILPCLLLAMSLAGCASTGPKEGYVYVPNQLSAPLIEKLYGIADKLNQEENLTAKFVEEQALLDIEIKAEQGSRYIWGVPGNYFYKQLCFTDEGFYKEIREAGVGIKYTLIDVSHKQKIGPWNAAACYN